MLGSANYLLALVAIIPIILIVVFVMFKLGLKRTVKEKRNLNPFSFVGRRARALRRKNVKVGFSRFSKRKFARKTRAFNKKVRKTLGRRFNIGNSKKRIKKDFSKLKKSINRLDLKHVGKVFDTLARIVEEIDAIEISFEIDIAKHVEEIKHGLLKEGETLLVLLQSITYKDKSDSKHIFGVVKSEIELLDTILKNELKEVNDITELVSKYAAEERIIALYERQLPGFVNNITEKLKKALDEEIKDVENKKKKLKEENEKLAKSGNIKKAEKSSEKINKELEKLEKKENLLKAFDTNELNKIKGELEKIYAILASIYTLMGEMLPAIETLKKNIDARENIVTSEKNNKFDFGEIKRFMKEYQDFQVQFAELINSFTSNISQPEFGILDYISKLNNESKEVFNNIEELFLSLEKAEVKVKEIKSVKKKEEVAEAAGGVSKQAVLDVVIPAEVQEDAIERMSYMGSAELNKSLDELEENDRTIVKEALEKSNGSEEEFYNYLRSKNILGESK